LFSKKSVAKRDRNKQKLKLGDHKRHGQKGKNMGQSQKKKMESPKKIRLSVVGFPRFNGKEKMGGIEVLGGGGI